MSDAALPSTVPYGRAEWTDFEDNWRDADATWLQERTILRYPSAGDRSVDWDPGSPTPPKFGQVTYNESALGENIDRLEMYSKQHAGWVPLLMLANLTGTQDSPAGVALSHKDADGKGVVFQPTQTLLDNPVNMMNGVLIVSASDVKLKTGAITATLTTDDTSLVVDKPIKAPSITFGGSGTIIDAPTATIKAGAFQGGTGSFTNVSMSGVLTGSKATFGGIDIGNTTANQINASAGYVSQGGIVYGDADGIVIRNRNPSTGALGACTVEVEDAGIVITGGSTYLRNTIRIENPSTPLRQAPWTVPGSAPLAYLGPAIYSATDPGAANYPNGTIWFS